MRPSLLACQCSRQPGHDSGPPRSKVYEAFEDLIRDPVRLGVVLERRIEDDRLEDRPVHQACRRSSWLCECVARDRCSDRQRDGKGQEARRQPAEMHPAHPVNPPRPTRRRRRLQRRAGVAPTLIRVATRSVSGLTRTTERVAGSAIHTDPSPTATRSRVAADGDRRHDIVRRGIDPRECAGADCLRGTAAKTRSRDHPDRAFPNGDCSRNRRSVRAEPSQRRC